jgi:uncharacterized protein YndB with AHSA1/START domain
MHTPANPSAVVHSTFSIERTYPSPPARVFAAFANQETKRRWFAEGEGWEVDEFTVDFRVGGREVARFRFKGGPPMGNDTVYLDIVPDRRIVFAYTMTVGDTRISVSLATVEIAPSGAGTRLVYTEQGAFFDGADKPARREAGCRGLLDKLGEELAFMYDTIGDIV